MKTYKGNVDITEANQKRWERKLKDVEKISGYLWVDSNVRLDAGKLESVGGNLWVDSDARLDALKSVGGSLWVYSNARLNVGKLESVCGDIDIHKTAKVSGNIVVLQVAKVL